MAGLKIESPEQLCALIEQWNENRLDLFHLEYLRNMEFRGIMRFYYQEPGEKVATKCLRVSSSEIARDVVALLIEKFRPDLKMLSQVSYSIWEVHENGRERKLMLDESPLIAQLCWHKDDLEGRFLLRRDDFMKSLSRSSNASSLKNGLSRSKNRFSKRDKRESARKSRASPKREIDEDSRSIYAELPSNTFTRTISNPEIVMQKRREQKIENRLKEITNDGGSLKIYGVDLFPNRPYVTLLVNTSDNSEKIIADALDKYGLENVSARDFLLVEMVVPTEGSEMSRSLSDFRLTDKHIERQLAYEEFPLLNLLSQRDAKNIVYLLRRRLDNSCECADISSTLTTARIDVNFNVIS